MIQQWSLQQNILQNLKTNGYGMVSQKTEESLVVQVGGWAMLVADTMPLPQNTRNYT